jgi:uncharacterized protein YneF (UPF0154 family)
MYWIALLLVGAVAFVAGYCVGISIAQSELEKFRMQVQLFKQVLPRIVKKE